MPSKTSIFLSIIVFILGFYRVTKSVYNPSLGPVGHNSLFSFDMDSIVITTIYI
jgi:hypothetical protein